MVASSVSVHNKIKTRQTAENTKNTTKEGKIKKKKATQKPNKTTKLKKTYIKIAVKLLVLRMKKHGLSLPERRVGSVVVSLVAQRKEDVKAEVG